MTKAEVLKENELLRAIIREYLALDVIDQDAPSGQSKKLEALEKRARKILDK